MTKTIKVALAGAGATLAVTSRTQADLATLPGDVLVLPGSVDDSIFVDDCVGRITTERGRLDILPDAFELRLPARADGALSGRALTAGGV